MLAVHWLILMAFPSGFQPRQEFYPPLEVCPPDCNYKDEPKRVKWRSKQNVDYAFLMLLGPLTSSIRNAWPFHKNLESFNAQFHPAGLCMVYLCLCLCIFLDT